jgi:NTP pyrophosphatase (non-canonical NTP hydrolase)
MKTFDEYEKAAVSTAGYPLIGENLVYPALGLAGESGEAADKVKKWWRNSGIFPSLNTLTPEQKTELIKEVGDVLWYIAAIANELNIPLEEIATANIAKLSDRRERGVVKSEGDNR